MSRKSDKSEIKSKKKTQAEPKEKGKTKETEQSEEQALPAQAKIERYLTRKYDFQFNEIKKEVFYKPKPIHQGEETENWQEVNVCDILRDLRLNGYKYSKASLEETLYSNFVSKYNPFTDYFKNLSKWDGTDHIKELCKYIVLVDEKDSEIERLYTMFKKWLVRCLRCLFGGAVNREVIMFKSDEQKIGKTQFFRFLVPEKLKDYAMENPEIGNKDALISLTENFIINFDEYDKYLKEGQLPVMKSYISQDAPKVRPPYGAKQIRMKRIASCVASTNINDFLRDETGNTRYICFDILGFEWQTYTKVIDIDKLWAQVYYLYQLALSGDYICDLTDKETKANDENNLKYLYHSSEFELIQRMYEPSDNQDDFKMCTEIVEYLQEHTRYRNITSNAVGRALTSLKYKKVHSKKDNKKQGYLIKLKEI